MPPYWLTPCLRLVGSPHVSALLLTHPTWLPSCWLTPCLCLAAMLSAPRFTVK